MAGYRFSELYKSFTNDIKEELSYVCVTLFILLLFELPNENELP